MTSENTLGRHLRYNAWYMEHLPKKIQSSVSSCGSGTLAAHGTSRLMLLGSPPDMIRGAPLRETGSAAACGGLVQIVFYFTILLRNYQLKFSYFIFPKISLYKSQKYGIISFVARKPAANGGVAQSGRRPGSVIAPLFPGPNSFAGTRFTSH